MGGQALGADHPNVTAAINNLVAVLEALGKYDDALQLYERRAAAAAATAAATPGGMRAFT